MPPSTHGRGRSVGTATTPDASTRAVSGSGFHEQPVRDLEDATVDTCSHDPQCVRARGKLIRDDSREHDASIDIGHHRSQPNRSREHVHHDPGTWCVARAQQRQPLARRQHQPAAQVERSTHSGAVGDLPVAPYGRVARCQGGRSRVTGRRRLGRCRRRRRGPWRGRWRWRGFGGEEGRECGRFLDRRIRLRLVVPARVASRLLPATRAPSPVSPVPQRTLPVVVVDNGSRCISLDLSSHRFFARVTTGSSHRQVLHRDR